MSPESGSNTGQWSVYLLWCDRQVIYTGIAKDPIERLRQHQAGAPHGAKFTRRFKQLELVYHTPVGNRSEATKIELMIKRLPPRVKQQIIANQPNLTALQAIAGG
jgi:putative endonuclease